MVIDMFCKCPSDLTCVHVLLHCEIRFLETIKGLDNDITLHLDLDGVCESIFFIIYILISAELFNFFYMTLIMSGVTGSREEVCTTFYENAQNHLKIIQTSRLDASFYIFFWKLYQIPDVHSSSQNTS